MRTREGIGLAGIAGRFLYRSALLLPAALLLQAAASFGESDEPTESVRRLQEPTVIAQLERRFVEGEPPDRQAAASTLLLIGRGGRRHLEYLLEAVTEAVASGIPFPYTLGSQGTPGLSDELRGWATERGIEIEAAVELAVIRYPTAVLHLGRAHEPLAKPALEVALSAQNYYIAAHASGGLARLGCDEPLIAKIVEAATKAPPELSLPFVSALVRCGTEEAAREAERLLVERLAPPGSAAARILAQRGESVTDLMEAVRESVVREAREYAALLALRTSDD